MSKYKIRFKAEDNLTIYQIAYRIEQFYKEYIKKINGEQLTSAWSTDEKMFVITWVDSVLETNYMVKVNMLYKVVVKSYSNNTFLTGMSTEELKFFDMLDFELESKYAEATNQTITDWFGEKE